MMDGLTTADENVKVVHTLVICDKRRDLQSIVSEVGIRFGAVLSTLTNILGTSKINDNLSSKNQLFGYEKDFMHLTQP